MMLPNVGRLVSLQGRPGAASHQRGWLSPGPVAFLHPKKNGGAASLKGYINDNEQ